MPSDWFQAQIGERIAERGGRSPVPGPRSLPGDAPATRRSYTAHQGARARTGQIGPFRRRIITGDPLHTSPGNRAEEPPPVFTLLRFAASCKPGYRRCDRKRVDVAEEDAGRDGAYPLELLETSGEVC